MSLKNFHLLFIAVSTLLAFVFGVWAVRSYATTDDGLELAMGIMSFLIAVMLIIYGVKFRQKIKEAGIL
jgi:predicted membrane protein